MLDLYVLDSCPYSKKVMDFMKKNDIKYKKRDVNDSKNLDMLIELGGEQQVPFLVDKERDIKMYESDDIIEYVSKVQ